VREEERKNEVEKKLSSLSSLSLFSSLFSTQTHTHTLPLSLSLQLSQCPFTVFIIPLPFLLPLLSFLAYTSTSGVVVIVVFRTRAVEAGRS
jgi:hypothetical protein